MMIPQQAALGLLMALAASSASATSVFISDAKMDACKGTIEFDVAYSGCGTTDFSLEVGICREIFPVSCDAELKAAEAGHCLAFFEEKVVISFADAGIDEPYFTRGHLSIAGGFGTEVSVTLPDLPWQAPDVCIVEEENEPRGTRI